MESDYATRGLGAGDVVPYLRLHCHLSEMEQTEKTVLYSTASLISIDTACFIEITKYVAECGAMLNSGTYELPEAPKRSDFDPELQAYKAQVKAEVEKKTASVGMIPDEHTTARRSQRRTAVSALPNDL